MNNEAEKVRRWLWVSGGEDGCGYEAEKMVVGMRLRRWL